LINPGAFNINGEIAGKDGKLMLTNLEYFNGTNSYISKYKQTNDSGYIEQIEGEKRDILFYDYQNDKK
jgi:hypothetical protein